MKNLLSKLVAFFLLIAACSAYAETQQQAIQRAADEYDANTKRFIEHTVECRDALQRDTDAKAFSEIMYIDNNDVNRYKLMGLTTKLTEEQKIVFNKFLVLNQNCRSNVSPYLSKLPYKIQGAMQKYYGVMDKIYVALLGNEITIGEANRKKQEAAEAMNSEVQQAHAEYMTQLRNAYVDASSADAERRQRAAQILAPYLLNNKPYQVPMPQVQQPIIRPPVNTNCTTYGNQTNCTSQ